MRLKDKSPEKYAKSLEKTKARMRHLYQNDASYRDRLRNATLMRTYGITTGQYANLFAEQKGVCAICKSSEDHIMYGKKRNLSVDHCHKTSVVRGLLCSDCNRAIGQLKDSPALLRAAADYIEKHQLPETK